MDISEVIICPESFLETLDQAPEAKGNIVPVIEIGVRDCGSIYREKEPIATDPGGGDKDWGVFLVLRLIKPAPVVQDFRDIVALAVVVEHGVRVYGQKSRIICVGVVYADND